MYASWPRGRASTIKELSGLEVDGGREEPRDEARKNYYCREETRDDAVFAGLSSVESSPTQFLINARVFFLYRLGCCWPLEWFCYFLLDQLDLDLCI